MKTTSKTKIDAKAMLADLTHAMTPEVYAINYRECGWPTDAYDLLIIWHNELQYAIDNGNDNEVRYAMRHIKQSMNEQCILVTR